MTILYILYNSVCDRYYIGMTDDLTRRLSEHNRNSRNHFTGRVSGIWDLLCSREFNSKIEARNEEVRLKKAKNRKYLEWYISQF